MIYDPLKLTAKILAESAAFRRVCVEQLGAEARLQIGYNPAEAPEVKDNTPRLILVSTSDTPETMISTVDESLSVTLGGWIWFLGDPGTVAMADNAVDILAGSKQIEAVSAVLGETLFNGFSAAGHEIQRVRMTDADSAPPLYCLTFDVEINSSLSLGENRITYNNE